MVRPLPMASKAKSTPLVGSPPMSSRTLATGSSLRALMPIVRAELLRELELFVGQVDDDDRVGAQVGARLDD